MMRPSCPQPIASPYSAQSGSCRGAWQIRHKKIEIRYNEPGLLPYGRVRLIHVVLKTKAHAIVERRHFLLISTETSALKLAEPYKKNIGKVTFQVSSFSNLQGNNTAQQLIMQMLEAKMKQEKLNNRL